jgi:prepilin-type N-terminal cleavage/methylation domain-containing protein
MRTTDFRAAVSGRRERGFTLTEVVVAMAITTGTFAVVIYGYVGANYRAEWSSNSLAAQSLAMQGVEQARAAKWEPQLSPAVDELGTTNYTQVDTLDVPTSGTPVYATNYISITTASANPPLRQLRADCVWMLGRRGPFTNTTITLRAPDQ